ncbi:S8/S53 family peptidase, partial [Desulfosporosinus sp. OT]|uniref:S8/S53 family peptidase n=1 Tax=Desulfosporosinus sp. OT TaxID=913865 RepID=UPI000223AE57
KAQNIDGDIIAKSNYSNAATISAPGSEIPVLSIDSKGNLIRDKAGGTSVATAEISGIIALILSSNNEVSRLNVITALKNSVGDDKFVNTEKMINFLKK